MRDVLGELLRWWTADEAAGLATVTATWASAPRQPGAAMVVGPDGSVAGSVSGGCVESAVYDLCREAASTGVARVVRFGVSDDDAYAAGLPCGGTIELLIERVDRRSFPELPALAAEVAAGRPVALVASLDGAVARHRLAHPDEVPGGTAFATVFAPPARMLVFGATDHAAAVAGIGAYLGYRVTVCDARPVFATERRFPQAAEVVADWPHRYLAAEAEAGRLDARTVVCVLTHDPKFDVPVLEVALTLPVAYVGAMGSRRTHHDRLARLRAAGVPAGALAKLSSPVGLDLGARTPEETAVSIAAEIVALGRGGTGRRLSATDGPIHGGMVR